MVVPAMSYGQTDRITTGAEQFTAYLNLLKGKRVALLINQTSQVNSTLLLDTLLSQNINIVKIFSPEHGLRGQGAAGEHISSSKDEKTGLDIISLYGKNKKPTAQQLSDVDVLIYDIQDVGARFYTYISTLQYAMEACAENKKKLMILDRPNPLGFMVDGPVLKKEHKSFVGMQPIPIIYGMTPGEYAKMLIGENWFTGSEKLDLVVIPCKNYDHSMKYTLPVSPSPNLRNMAAIYLYPSLCLFEGTVISVGRGTEMPFQQYGHPKLEGNTIFSFIPSKKPGQAAPMLWGETCYGQIIATNKEEALLITQGEMKLIWLIKAYTWYPDKKEFFNNFFEKLAGTSELRKQIENGVDEATIRAGWKKDLDAFKQIRKKYLIYKDFES